MCRRSRAVAVTTFAIAGLLASIVLCVGIVVKLAYRSVGWGDMDDQGRMMVERQFGLDWSLALDPTDPELINSHVRVGWPLRILERRTQHVARPKSPPGSVVIKPEYMVSGALLDDVVLYRPCWPGFLITCVGWIGVSWLAVTSFIMVRRHQRSMAGRCDTCGYILKDGTRCSECGAEQSFRSQAWNIGRR